MVSSPITSSNSGGRKSISAEAESEHMTAARALDSEVHGELVDEVGESGYCACWNPRS